jgi:mono/diheme cytochrome c family protein
MNKPRKKGRLMRLGVLLAILGLIGLAIAMLVVHKTTWAVPPEAKAMKNPLAPSDENLASAKQVYSDQCANCHGDTGKGDGSDAMMYDPAPSDLTDAAKMGQVTDGDIYYQITHGRKPMPSFRKKLSDQQRWQLVLLVRSFAEHSASPPATKQPDVPGNKPPVPSGQPK